MAKALAQLATARPQEGKSLFGKSLSSTKPQQGLTGVRIQTEERGHIPGIADHWRHDIENRKKAIIEAGQHSLRRRALKYLGKERIEPEVSGDEIAQWHPTPQVRTFVEQLKSDPRNGLVRLQLVFAVGKSSRDLPIEAYRTLLLQALVACSLGEFNMMGLKIALSTQVLYLAHLHTAARANLSQVQSQVELISSGESSSKNRKGLLETSQKLQENLDIIRMYQNYFTKGMKHQSNLRGSVFVDELRKLMSDSRAPDKMQKELVKKITTILNFLRYLPLLAPEAEELAALMIRMNPNDPTGYFLKARLSMSLVNLAVKRYDCGDRDASVQKIIQRHFKNAHENFESASTYIPKPTSSTLDHTILLEYAHSIHYFYRIVVEAMRVRFSSSWLSQTLHQALHILDNARDSGKTSWLEEQIKNALRAEGLI